MPLDEQRTRRALKKLMGELSHEVRTPNSVIKHFSMLMLMDETGSLNEKQREYLIAIHQSSIELLKATNHLFIMARVFYGGIELSIEEVDLAQFIPQTITAARKYWPTQYPSFDIIEQQIPDELPSIWMDRQWVQQAIIGVLFEVEKKILLTVAHDDTSVKLNISTLEYPRFFNEESPRLFFAQAIAEQHGGEMKIRKTESQLEVILTLPISKNRPVLSS